MKVKYLKATNFLSIGRTPVEIDFTKYGNIVNIKGENLDMGVGASNGAGKTTCLEAIVYGLYGKLIKGLNHKQAINIHSKQDLEIEIHVDDYRIIRTRDIRGGGTLRVFYKNEEKTRGGMPATQQYIVEDILKLSYQAFTNIVCFGQHMEHSFLTAEAKDKRAIAENLLSLDKYGRYCEGTKKKVKILNDKIDQLRVLYDKDIMALDSSRRQVDHVQFQRDQWQERRDMEVRRIKESLAKTTLALEATDDGAVLANYNLAQKELIHVNASLAELDEKHEKLHAIRLKIEDRIEATKNERHDISLLVKNDEYEVNRIRRDIDDCHEQIKTLVSQKGSRCPACYGVVGEENCQHLLNHSKSVIEDARYMLVDAEAVHDGHVVKLHTYDKQLASLNENLQDAREKERSYAVKIKELVSRRASLSQIAAPQAGSQALLLQQEALHLQERLNSLQADVDPYKAIYDQVVGELARAGDAVKVRKAEIKGLEADLPYYEFWLRGFGDQGIRSFVLKEIMPMLNARINYWLQFLVDNRIQINFNTELEETIERSPPDGDPFVYHAMSGGEHRRIDLAISQAFAHVMMLTSGGHPSVVCLDEVGTNLDRPGIQAIYRMICELARDRQVLVTTHDPDLLELLSSYDTITMVKQGGFSTFKKEDSDAYIMSQ